MKYFGLIFVLLLFAGCTDNDDNFVSVDGKAVMRVPADYVYINGALSATGIDIKSLKNKQAELRQNLLKDLAAISYPTDSITFSINKIISTMGYDGQPQFQASQTMILKVENLDIVGKIFEILADNGLAKTGFDPVIRNTKEIESKITEKAIQDAQKRAANIAGLVHRKLGKVINLSRASIVYNQDMPAMDSPAYYGKLDDAFLILKQKVTGSVSVKFELLD